MKLKKTFQDYFFVFAAIFGVTVITLQIITLIFKLII